MNDKTWKVLAIVFMSLFILESLFLGWAMIEGSNQIQIETECSAICADKGAVYYIDEVYEKICYCIIDDENVHVQYMGD